jgi:hypothetical protein
MSIIILAQAYTDIASVILASRLDSALGESLSAPTINVYIEALYPAIVAHNIAIFISSNRLPYY